eukprot:scaffold36304_cov121-Isochrysis_galbana.AAC.11
MPEEEHDGSSKMCDTSANEGESGSASRKLPCTASAHVAPRSPVTVGKSSRHGVGARGCTAEAGEGSRQVRTRLLQQRAPPGVLLVREDASLVLHERGKVSRLVAGSRAAVDDV